MRGGREPCYPNARRVADSGWWQNPSTRRDEGITPAISEARGSIRQDFQRTQSLSQDWLEAREQDVPSTHQPGSTRLPLRDRRERPSASPAGCTTACNERTANNGLTTTANGRYRLLSMVRRYPVHGCADAEVT